MLSVLLHVVLLVATNEIQPSTNQEFGKVCMRHSVGIEEMHDEDAKGFVQMLGIVDGDKAPMDPCDWKGVKCGKDGIKSILWTNPKRSRFATLNWLPATLLEILIHKMSINAVLETRVLPRALKMCGFVACRLHGTLCLDTLPQDLIEINLNSNNFSGTVHFSDLPQSLVYFDLVHNYIETVTVYQLPKSLKSMFVYSWDRNFEIQFPESEFDQRQEIAETPSFSESFEELLIQCE